MSQVHLKNLVTGGVTEELDSESEIYRKLILQTQSNGKPKWEQESIVDITGVKTRILVAKVPPIAITADETIKLTAGAGKGATITAAEYTADETITGVTTNTRTITVVDLDDGKTKATLALTTGVNAEAGVAKSLTVGDSVLGAGEALKVVSTHGGTGIADPGGIVTVEIEYSA